jgi:multiple sugar transport system ATP-binding protein
MIDGGLALPSGAVLPLHQQMRVPNNRKLTYGIRPEHLHLAPAGAPGTIPAVVAVIEPTGLDTTLIVKAEGGSLTVVLRERVTLRPGDAIALKPAPEQSHLFDETGSRLATL